MKINITKSVISIVLIVAVVVGTQQGLKWFEATQIKPKSSPPEALIAKVEVRVVELSDYPIVVRSNGKVEAAKRSQLSAEIAGTVTRVSEDLEVGKIVPKGAFLIEVDGSDYAAALASAEAAVAEAQLLIVQEEARAAMNLKEWKRLGKGEPTDLIIRKPQLTSARARLVSAEAAVAKARRDLERTTVVAPYEMRIEAKHTEVGNYLIPGGKLADGHSASQFEIRLLVNLDDYQLIRDKSKPIELVAQLGTQRLRWQALYQRDEGMVDQQTLSLPVMARILPNETQKEFKWPPVGLYLEANISAQEMLKQVVIPRDSVRFGDIVLLVNQQNRLEKRSVKVLFTDRQKAIVEGLEPGERIITNPMETPIEGMEVEVMKESAPADQIAE